jgi:hypothetical protein
MLVSVVIQFGSINNSDCYLLFYLSAIFSVCLVVVLASMRQQHLKQLETLQGKAHFERKKCGTKTTLYMESVCPSFKCGTDHL